MTRRRANGQGGIKVIRRAAGALVYEARLRGVYLGTFEKRAQAEAAIERAAVEADNRAFARMLRHLSQPRQPVCMFCGAPQEDLGALKTRIVCVECAAKRKAVRS